MTMASHAEHSSNLVKRDGLGSEIERRNETASAAVAARATAAIQARYVMAFQRPRNMDQVRLDVMSECDRPRFAEVARYSLPRSGKAITGWTIRFVEAVVRCMKNLSPEVTTLYDDPSKRIVRCSVVDLESNVEWAQEITIEKTVERRELKEGQIPLGQRRNSYGDIVYVVPTTDDDFRQKEGAAVSKTLRTLGLRLIPGDILDEAEKRVLLTMKREGAADPAAARKRLVDAFAGIGVRPDQLVEYLGGRPLDGITDDERIELQGVFAAMKEGERWADLIKVSPHRGTEAEEKDDRLKNVQKKVQEKVAGMRQKKAQKPTKNGAAAAPKSDPGTASPPAQDQPPADAPPASEEPADPEKDGR
jgi:hypothetical protein